MRRGDIRTAVLAVLAEEPGHGYDVIQRLEEKTAGAWRPSPGSVYPTLQLLEDEGLVRSVERDSKRAMQITATGRVHLQGRRGRRNAVGPRRSRRRPHRSAARRDASAGVRPSRSQMNNRDRLDRTIEILKRARKEIYTMLAED